MLSCMVIPLPAAPTGVLFLLLCGFRFRGEDAAAIFLDFFSFMTLIWLSIQFL